MADGGHVAGAMALAETGLVVGEGDVEHPVQAVLDGPVLADGFGGVGRGEGAGGDEVAGLGAGGAAAFDAGLGAEQAGGAGRRSSPGKRRPPSSQSNSRTTLIRRSSTRP